MKYKVNYRYLMEGVVWVEAQSKKEAEYRYIEQELDNERIVKWYKPKIVKS